MLYRYYIITIDAQILHKSSYFLNLLEEFSLLEKVELLPIFLTDETVLQWNLGVEPQILSQKYNPTLMKWLWINRFLLCWLALEADNKYVVYR